MANLVDPHPFPGTWHSDWSREHAEADFEASTEADTEARTEAARLKRLSAQLPCCIFELERAGDGDAHFAFLGANSQAVCGVPWGRLKDSPGALADFVAPTHREEFVRSLQAALAHDAPWHWEGPLQGESTVRWLQASAEPQPTDDPGACVWVGMFQDVTLRRASEAALERALADLTETATKERLRAQSLKGTCERLAERNRLLGAQSEGWERREKSAALARLALGLAHEINNPLAGVTYMFEALQSGTLPADRQGDYARSVEAGLQRIQGTTHNLLRYAQPTPPQIGACAWPAIAASAEARLQPALAAHGLQLTAHWGRGKATMRGDPRLLEEALTHVLLNAVHASAPRTQIELSLRRSEGKLGLLVRDHGTGIPAEYLSHVCDPFFTTKQQGEGTGLGLATASRMLEVQRGALEIESEEGRGTQVTLWVPV